MIVLSQQIIEHDFVLFYNITTAAAILSVLATFGVDAQFQKKLAETDEHTAHIGEITYFKISSSIPVSTFAFIIAWYMLNEITLAFLFSILTVAQCFLTHFENTLYLVNKYSKDLSKYNAILITFFSIKLLIIYQTKSIETLIALIIFEMIALIYLALYNNKELVNLKIEDRKFKFHNADQITNTLIEFFAMIVIRLPQYLTSAYGLYEYSKIIILLQKPIEFVLVLTSQWNKQIFQALKKSICSIEHLGNAKVKVFYILILIVVFINIIFFYLPTEIILGSKMKLIFFVMSLTVISHSYLNFSRQINNMNGQFRINLIGYFLYTCFSLVMCLVGISYNSLEIIAVSLSCAGLFTLFSIAILTRN